MRWQGPRSRAGQVEGGLEGHLRRKKGLVQCRIWLERWTGGPTVGGEGFYRYQSRYLGRRVRVRVRVRVRGQVDAGGRIQAVSQCANCRRTAEAIGDQRRGEARPVALLPILYSREGEGV